MELTEGLELLIEDEGFCRGVYGLDHALWDPTKIATATDFELFLEYAIILYMKSHKMRIRDTMHRKVAELMGKFPKGNERKSLALTEDYLIYHICQRNHIPTSYPAVHRLSLSATSQDTLVSWYQFYDDYLNSQFPSLAREQLYEQYLHGEDISKYAPPASWLESF